jgi:hypothetical protein
LGEKEGIDGDRESGDGEGDDGEGARIAVGKVVGAGTGVGVVVATATSGTAIDADGSVGPPDVAMSPEQSVQLRQRHEERAMTNREA